jgi:uncharacterized protein (TIGR00251 family)
MNKFITWQDNDLLLAIQLQPRAAKNEFINNQADQIKIRITAPPVDNEANEQLIKFIAKEFGVPQAKVTIEKGLHSRKKLLRINTPRKFPAKIFPNNNVLNK